MKNKINIGQVLQYSGIIIAVAGFVVVGKIGADKTQVAILASGIIISIIGFLIILGQPSNVKEIQKRKYIPTKEKNREYRKRTLQMLTIMAFVSYLQRDNIGTYPLLLLVPLTILFLSMLTDYVSIYKKNG